MSRLKSMLAVAILAAIAGVVPQAHAQATVKVIMAGASGAWQAMALGTFKAGSCPTGSHPGCAHYTNSAFNLTDTRPTLNGLGGTAVTDVGAVWIVWDNTTADPTCATACNVWAYVKVDSIVGDRCYFAQPQCNINVTPFPAPNQQIATNLWGADSTPPATVQALFTTGAKVGAAVTEIRPEDAMFGECRANSLLGGGNDGLNGLGYVSAGGTNASGTCPAHGASLINLEGQSLASGLPGGSTSTAHLMAFNISGTDPFTGTKIPAYSSVSVGVYPVVFITGHTPGSALAGVTDTTLAQAQAAFSGANCQANNFAGGTANPIAVYLREPLSGTMNTAEYTAFRFPRDASGNYDLVNGASQETGVNSANPVNNLACGVSGSRYSVIGTGEEVKAVKNSTTNPGVDGIGYTFFSYGNISSIASNANYSYLTVNGVDPIFAAYGSTYDPAEPTTAGELPGTANLPAACAGAFPCSETQMWAGHQSFPNIRNGSYRQWALVRLVSTGTALANARTLITSAQASSVTTVPDFIPAAASSGDKGLPLFRSHYTQEGVAPANNPTDKGGEEGGCIIANGSVATKLVQRAGGCVVGP